MPHALVASWRLSTKQHVATTRNERPILINNTKKASINHQPSPTIISNHQKQSPAITNTHQQSPATINHHQQPLLLGEQRAMLKVHYHDRMITGAFSAMWSIYPRLGWGNLGVAGTPMTSHRKDLLWSTPVTLQRSGLLHGVKSDNIAIFETIYFNNSYSDQDNS